jgi:hypothetical protein
MRGVLYSMRGSMYSPGLSLVHNPLHRLARTYIYFFPSTSFS